jgi:hypothetical protein
MQRVKLNPMGEGERVFLVDRANMQYVSESNPEERYCFCECDLDVETVCRNFAV